MKKPHIFGLFAAIALIIFSIAFPVPEKHIDVSSYYSAYQSSWKENVGAEYVGGDAYNYQMEATLKAGYMSGILAMKAVTFVGGVLLLFLTLYSYSACSLEEYQNNKINEISRAVQRNEDSMKALSGELSKQTSFLYELSSTAEKYASPNNEEISQ